MAGSGTGSAAQARQAVQKVYSEWCVKAAEIILASRVDAPGLTVGESPHVAASFNLRVPELFCVRREAIAGPDFFRPKAQRSFHLEVFLGSQDSDGAPDADGGESEAARLLERWTFTFFPANPEPVVLDRSSLTLVRKLSVTLRSLLCHTRLLPAYALCQGAGVPPRHWRLREEVCPTERSPDLSTTDFVSLQSSIGTLRLSVGERRDAKALQQRASCAPECGPSYAAPMEHIEVEDGFFAVEFPTESSPRLARAAAASPGLAGSIEMAATTGRGKLGKIAEEPSAAAGSGGSSPVAEPPAAPASRPASPCPDGAAVDPVPAPGRQRGSSYDSVTSSATSLSGSSRWVAEAAAVVLGSTPPLASAWAPLGQSLQQRSSGLSASSSRSGTPQSTPKLNAAPTPASGAAPAEAASGRRSPPPGSSHLAGGCSGDELDDLSGIWARAPLEWSRRRSVSIGVSSRGSHSRSPTPEAQQTASPTEARRKALPSRSGGSASANTSAADGEVGEMCLFGMSDEEVEEGSGSGESQDEDDALLGRNVVASAIHQGGGGGAFASPGASKMLGSLEGLQTCALDADSDAPNFPSPKLTSPLIAALNPFAAHLPMLDLPPSMLSPAGSFRGVGEDAQIGISMVEQPPGPAASSYGAMAASCAEDARSSGACAETQDILVEMGDLLCHLQRQEELTITAQEAQPQAMLAKLEHFREVAASMGIRRS